MTFIHHDGGRQAAGFVGKAGDCAVRACAIALDRPYREVYDAINAIAKTEHHDTRKASNARTGVWPATVTTYLAQVPAGRGRRPCRSDRGAGSICGAASCPPADWSFASVVISRR